MSEENETKRTRSKTLILSLEPRGTIINRFVTYFAFFLVIFLVGTPIWYSTTSIPKEIINVNKINEIERSLHSNVAIEVPVYLNPTSDAMDQLVLNTQKMCDKYVQHFKTEFEVDSDFNYKLKIIKGTAPSKQDFQVKIEHSPENKESVKVLPVGKDITIYTTDELIATNYVADFVAKVLLEEVFKYELMLYSKKEEYSGSNVAFETGANYHLSFSLLNGDGDYLSWEFRKFFNKKMNNFMKLISQFANFTVDSQIQYYAQLSKIPTYDEESKAFVLKKDDTSIFVNHERWNLDNNALIAPSNDKDLTVINLVLYVPSKEFQPLVVDNSKTNSFIIPQYGGIQIKNNFTSNEINEDELNEVFEIFISQIFTLLGLRKEPKSPFIRIDFLTRFFIINNLTKSVNNLNSLIRLINSLPSISIPTNTKIHVEDSLKHVESSIDLLNHGEFIKGCEQANKALVESNLAFFEKEMVQQIYFPEEHKFAVYSPLLGPIFTILILGLMRLFSDVKTWKKHYRKSV